MHLKNPYFDGKNFTRKTNPKNKPPDSNRTRIPVTISLPPEMARELKYIAHENRFSSISEFIRYTIRLFLEYEVENAQKESIIERNLRRKRAQRRLTKSFRELELRKDDLSEDQWDK